MAVHVSSCVNVIWISRYTKWSCRIECRMNTSLSVAGVWGILWMCLLEMEWQMLRIGHFSSRWWPESCRSTSLKPLCFKVVSMLSLTASVKLNQLMYAMNPTGREVCHTTFPGTMIGRLFMQACAVLFSRWPIQLSHKIFCNLNIISKISNINLYPATLMIVASISPASCTQAGSRSFMNSMIGYVDRLSLVMIPDGLCPIIFGARNDGYDATCRSWLARWRYARRFQPFSKGNYNTSAFDT